MPSYTNITQLRVQYIVMLMRFHEIHFDNYLNKMHARRCA